MKAWLFSNLLALVATVQGATVWQQRNVTFDVPASSLGVFPSNFTSKSDALSNLEAVFNSSKISRSGDYRYGATIARVWTEQRKVWPEMILYPESAEDVSIVMQFYSAAHALWGDDGFAISTYMLVCTFVVFVADISCSGRWSCRFWWSAISKCHRRSVSSSTYSDHQTNSCRLCRDQATNCRTAGITLARLSSLPVPTSAPLRAATAHGLS